MTTAGPQLVAYDDPQASRYALPLATVVIGGPVTSTLLTLLVLPPTPGSFVLDASRVSRPRRRNPPQTAVRIAS
ncbi:MAG TPA: hypothetical protein VGG06_17490 [Thermoanaerobaculia bacterium]